MKIEWKLTIKKIIAAILFTALLISPSAATGASGAVLEANDAGLEFRDAPSQLVDLTDMAPGDTRTATVSVENKVDFAFAMSVSIYNLTEPGSGADPAEKFIITAYRDGARVARFGTAQPDMGAMGQEAIERYYPLDDPHMPVEIRGEYHSEPFVHIYNERFEPGTVTELTFEIHLLGPESGNEYQGKSAQLRWVFEAVADEVPPGGTTERPTTPTTPTEPTSPATPTNPIDPTDPSGPANPTEPTTPTEPTATSELEATTESEQYEGEPEEATVPLGVGTFENETTEEALEDGSEDAPAPLAGVELKADSTENMRPAPMLGGDPAVAHRIEDNTAAMGVLEFEMPTTGEPPLYFSIMIGMAIICAGAAVALGMAKGDIRPRTRRKRKKMRFGS